MKGAWWPSSASIVGWALPAAAETTHPTLVGGNASRPQKRATCSPLHLNTWRTILLLHPPNIPSDPFPNRTVKIAAYLLTFARAPANRSHSLGFE